MRFIPGRPTVWSPCGGCGDLSENWFCLACCADASSSSESDSASSTASGTASDASGSAATASGVFCSRHVNAHMLGHFRALPSHCVAYSLSDASVWCFACDSYVDHATLRPVHVALAASMHGADSGTVPCWSHTSQSSVHLCPSHRIQSSVPRPTAYSGTIIQFHRKRTT
jgi:hypothetical protein